ncbi:hypothetical protein HDV01_002095 [Terramyces sp. JEL0728]|nr:hypothetical protein HDV01_002095 [Terramyces sp. JEL0728]
MVSEFKIDSPKLERQDSKMDDIPQYSVYHALDILMKGRLSKLSIHFHSYLLECLPWTRGFETLSYLDLKILVTDAFLSVIFKEANNLKSLYLQRAEISDDGLFQIADKCKQLVNLYINMIPLSERSRYAMMTDTSRGKLISNSGAQHLFENLEHLISVVINNVELGPECFTMLNPNIISLSLNLSYSVGMTFESVELLLKELPDIKQLKLIPGSSLLESVITEEFITGIPEILKKIEKIDLQGFDYRKDNVYYGVKSNMWYLDEFNQKFKKMYPEIQLVYNNQAIY